MESEKAEYLSQYFCINLMCSLMAYRMSFSTNTVKIVLLNIKKAEARHESNRVKKYN